MSRTVNAVIDTNIFINGLFFSKQHENCTKVLDYIDEGKIRPFFSQESIGELVYLVKNFARYNLDTETERLTYLNGMMNLFYYGHSANTEKTECEEIKDRNDLMFLKTAIEGKVDYIITKDYSSGLFNINNKKFKVVDAKQFVNIIEVNERIANE